MEPDEDPEGDITYIPNSNIRCPCKLVEGDVPPGFIEGMRHMSRPDFIVIGIGCPFHGPIACMAPLPPGVIFCI